MKKIFKKALSVFLALLLIVCAVPMKSGMKAYAVSMTWNEYWSKVTSFINDSRWSNGTWYGNSQSPKLSSYSISFSRSKTSAIAPAEKIIGHNIDFA